MLRKLKSYIKKRTFKHKRRMFCKKWHRQNKNWCECKQKRRMFERDLEKWLREYEG